MNKSAFVTVAIFFGFVSGLAAQKSESSLQLQGPLPALSQPGVSLNSLLTHTSLLQELSETYQGYPSLALSDGHSFVWPDFAWIEPGTPEFLPPVQLASPSAPKAKRIAAATQTSNDKVVEVKPRLFDYADGEVGVLYGKSFGKYSGSVEQGYIFGEVGNDNIHISAGASYQDSTVRYPRFGR